VTKDIQGERQYTGIGIYHRRLSGAGSFTWGLKNNSNTASNYTAINKPVAHVQTRTPNRVCTGDDTAIAGRLDTRSPEPNFEGPCGWNRDAIPIIGRRQQVLPCTALPQFTCCTQIQKKKCLHSEKKGCFRRIIDSWNGLGWKSPYRPSSSNSPAMGK